MNLPPEKPLPPRRVPQRANGARRVEELLAATAQEIALVGYEAATMKAIARRAGASVGAAYQYFPDKEAVVQALLARYFDELDAHTADFTAAAARLSVPALAGQIVSLMADFIRARPAFIPLLSGSLEYRRDAAARHRLREYYATLFRKKRPSLDRAEAFLIANVTVQIVKGMHSLLTNAAPEQQDVVFAEFQTALGAYLVSRLQT